MRTLLIALAVLVVGCDSADEPVDGGLVVSLVSLPPSGGGATELSVLVETEEDYPCSNYQLRAEADRDDRRLGIDVGGAELPGDVCLTALGPATWSSPLGVEGDFRGYRIEVVLDGRTDVYEVFAGVGGTGLDPIRTSFSRPGPR